MEDLLYNFFNVQYVASILPWFANIHLPFKNIHQTRESAVIIILLSFSSGISLN